VEQDDPPADLPRIHTTRIDPRRALPALGALLLLVAASLVLALVPSVVAGWVMGGLLLAVAGWLVWQAVRGRRGGWGGGLRGDGVRGGGVPSRRGGVGRGRDGRFRSAGRRLAAAASRRFPRAAAASRRMAGKVIGGTSRVRGKLPRALGGTRGKAPGKAGSVPGRRPGNTAGGLRDVLRRARPGGGTTRRGPGRSGGKAGPSRSGGAGGGKPSGGKAGKTPRGGKRPGMLGRLAEKIRDVLPGGGRPSGGKGGGKPRDPETSRSGPGGTRISTDGDLDDGLDLPDHDNHTPQDDDRDEDDDQDGLSRWQRWGYGVADWIQGSGPRWLGALVEPLRGPGPDLAEYDAGIDADPDDASPPAEDWDIHTPVGWHDWPEDPGPAGYEWPPEPPPQPAPSARQSDPVKTSPHPSPHRPDQTKTNGTISTRSTTMTISASDFVHHFAGELTTPDALRKAYQAAADDAVARANQLSEKLDQLNADIRAAGHLPAAAEMREKASTLQDDLDANRRIASHFRFREQQQTQVSA
jgi:hypothetical protein